MRGQAGKTGQLGERCGGVQHRARDGGSAVLCQHLAGLVARRGWALGGSWRGEPRTHLETPKAKATVM